MIASALIDDSVITSVLPCHNFWRRTVGNLMSSIVFFQNNAAQLGFDAFIGGAER